MPPSALSSALAAVRDALRPEVAIDRLCRYYDPAGNYAGATFADLHPAADRDLTAADLYAVTLLSVRAPRPQPTRLILEPSSVRTELLDLLNAGAIGPAVQLADADGATIAAMSRLYVAVKGALGVNPWVTASKLCARERPALFPVRDNLVRGRRGLDLTRFADYTVDWRVFRALMLDNEVQSDLRSVASAAAAAGARLDDYPLRWLDVLLWMRARD